MVATSILIKPYCFLLISCYSLTQVAQFLISLFHASGNFSRDHSTMPRLLLLPVQSIGELPPLELLQFATCVLEMVLSTKRFDFFFFFISKTQYIDEKRAQSSRKIHKRSTRKHYLTLTYTPSKPKTPPKNLSYQHCTP